MVLADAGAKFTVRAWSDSPAFEFCEGAKAGVVINPATPISTLEEVLGIADFVLVMSVNPGFGGQKFIPYTLDKVRKLAMIRRERGLNFPIEIDGGVTKDNVQEIIRAGVEWAVAGASVFSGGDIAGAYRELAQRAQTATAVTV